MRNLVQPLPSMRCEHCDGELLFKRIDPEALSRQLERRRAKFASPSSSSGRGSNSPRPERFVPEDAERVTGCEMTLEVESVVDGGMNRQEALG